MSNCAAGLDRAFHWVDFGSSGYKLWAQLPLQQAYYAPLLLHTVARLGANATFVAATAGNPDLDVYAWSAPRLGGLYGAVVAVVAFNRRSLVAAEAFAVAFTELGGGGLNHTEAGGSGGWSVAVYEYSANRTVMASVVLATIPAVMLHQQGTPNRGASSTLRFSYALPAYSFSVFILTPPDRGTTLEDDTAEEYAINSANLDEVTYVAPLTLLPQDTGTDSPACLDGSPYGFYFAKSPTNSTKWTISLQGGGWCYDEDTCFARSKMSLGSSKNWEKATNCKW